jgi:hypothetical protein
VTPRGPWLLAIGHSGVAAELATIPRSPLPGPPRDVQLRFPDRAPRRARPRLQARRQPPRHSTYPVPRADLPSTADDRGRTGCRPAHWPGHLPRCVDGLLGRLLPDHRHHRSRLAARLPHRALGRMRRCATARVHNGLLLSALWDAAFDTGLVSFADDGTVLASPELSAAARTALSIESTPRLSNLRDAHRANLAAHRARHGFLGISGEPSPKPPGEALGV